MPSFANESSSSAVAAAAGPGDVTAAAAAAGISAGPAAPPAAAPADTPSPAWLPLSATACEALCVDAAAAMTATGGWATLDQYSVIDAVGPDARTFLHNQLTNDVLNLPDDVAAIGGLCSPKGRLLATFLYWPLSAAATDAEAPATGTGIRLILSADIAPAIAKRLQMFILRSKVKLHLRQGQSQIGAAADGSPSLPPGAPSASCHLLGLTVRESDVAAFAAQLGDVIGGAPAADNACWTFPGGAVVRLASAVGWRRYLAAIDSDAIADRLRAAWPQYDKASWEWLEVLSAQPRIVAATQDRFVPQMINYEALGGVNFRKGCYPGQEIVARSQYRGTIKRRATLAVSASGQAGDEIFDAGDASQPCGMIVNAAAAPGGGCHCLVELKLALPADADLRVGRPDGPALRPLGLPYALPALS